MKNIDVIALGELLIDFTENGLSENENPLLEANPGGAPCNVLAMLQRLGKKTAFIGKVGKDAFGKYLMKTVSDIGIDITNLVQDESIPTTLAFVHTAEDGDRSFSFYRNPGADMMLAKENIDYSQIDEAKIFHDEVKALFPDHDIVMDPLSLSVSCHIGPGAVALACSKKLDV